jgi:hypothetical protein
MEVFQAVGVKLTGIQSIRDPLDAIRLVLGSSETCPARHSHRQENSGNEQHHWRRERGFMADPLAGFAQRG